MLVHPWDAPVGDDEWRAVLERFDFGQLVAPGGPERELPVVVPTHFLFDGDRTIELHLARPNPVWRALEERPRALLTVIADYVYVDAATSAGPGGDPNRAVPTSYYATVQAEVDVEIVDDPGDKAAILTRQLARFEPAGSRRLPVDATDDSDRRHLPGIRGLRLTVTGVRAKFKYGGNKSVEHRLLIAQALASRDAPMDASARDRLLDRLAAEGSREGQ
jgi:transcriptional regulator